MSYPKFIAIVTAIVMSAMAIAARANDTFLKNGKPIPNEDIYQEALKDPNAEYQQCKTVIMVFDKKTGKPSLKTVPKWMQK